MANTRKAAYKAPAVDTSRILAKPLPEEARLSSRNSFFRRRRWLVWLGVALVLLAALLWATVTYIDRVGWEFFYKGRDAGLTLNAMARVLRARDLATL
jgi:hypothetical protein